MLADSVIGNVTTKCMEIVLKRKEHLSAEKNALNFFIQGSQRLRKMIILSKTDRNVRSETFKTPLRPEIISFCPSHLRLKHESPISERFFRIEWMDSDEYGNIKYSWKVVRFICGCIFSFNDKIRTANESYVSVNSKSYHPTPWGEGIWLGRGIWPKYQPLLFGFVTDETPPVTK